jgi:outer membrane protein W
MKKLVFIPLFVSFLSADGVFSIGHKNFSFNIGQDNIYGNDYTVIGVSFNYFLVDNFSTGITYTAWLGDDPAINKFTIPFTYYVPLSQVSYRPYLGAFYSHTLMGDNDGYSYRDYDSYGGKVGITFKVSPNSYVSFGWVQEFYDDGIESSSRGYPQFSGGVSF